MYQPNPIIVLAMSHFMFLRQEFQLAPRKEVVVYNSIV